MKHHKDQAAIIWLLITAYLVSGADISCISPQNVAKGKSASLTCLYNQNLQREKQDFYIYRHQLDKDAVIVAICAWEDSSLTCDFQPGYNATVRGYNVTLSISSVGAEHAGNYTCTKLPPNDDDETEHCVLTVEAQTTTPKVSCFAPAHLSRDRPLSVTCIFPDGLDADNLSLQRHDTSPSTRPVDVVRCDRDDSCTDNNEDGLEVKTEHKKADGFRLITAKVNKAGHYICRATKDTKQEEICVMEVKKVAVTTDGLDDSLQKLSAPMYGILIILILLIVGGGVGLFVKRCSSRRNNHSYTTETPLSEAQRLAE